MAQDVVGGRAVEIEVRQDEVEQKRLPRELALVRAELERVEASIAEMRKQELDLDARLAEVQKQKDELVEARQTQAARCQHVGHGTTESAGDAVLFHRSDDGKFALRDR